MATHRDEIISLREKETSASHAESEVSRLQERLIKLEVTLEITTKEREDAFKKAKNESASYKSMLDELERTRDEVHRYRNAMKNLNEELDQRQEESLKAKERIFQMESSLRAFKNEAKERVSTLADREKHSSGILERTRHENRDLTSNLHNMNDMVERLRRERDICFQSLQDGRKKLSELSSRKDSLVNLEDLFSSPSNQCQSPRRSREPRITPRYSQLPVESITGRVVPEIYVSGYHLGALGSPTTLAEERAEEIAACVALNAKDSLEENLEEVSHLRSQIYRLEDERSVQVASLKSRVRNLEKDLTDERVGQRNSMEDEKSEQISSLRAKVRNLEKDLSYERVGNRTPVMGSSARRSRKQNHFVDWDEKHWDEKYAY
jgi:chromosome segregation ATPase